MSPSLSETCKFQLLLLSCQTEPTQSYCHLSTSSNLISVSIFCKRYENMPTCPGSSGPHIGCCTCCDRGQNCAAGNLVNIAHISSHQGETGRCNGISRRSLALRARRSMSSRDQAVASKSKRSSMEASTCCTAAS